VCATVTPQWPNWQRQRIQTPHGVGSSPTWGTTPTPDRRYSNRSSRRTCTAPPRSGIRLYTVVMNEPVAKAQDLELDAATFWLDTDLENLLVDIKPYEGPQDYAIDDLTDDEWDRFVAALNE
jgi:hypothetical protein